MARIPLSVETRRQAYDADPKWPTKALIRIIAITFASASLILFAIAVSLTNQNFTNLDGPGQWTDGMALAPTAFALLYNILSLFTLHRPAHPLLHVLLTFLTWALCIPCLVFGTAGGLFWYWTAATPSMDGSTNCSFFFNAWAEVCSPVAYTVGRMEIAGLVGLFVVFLLHLVLFTMAVKDTIRWRAERRGSSTDRKSIEKTSFELQYTKDVEGGSMRPASLF